MSPKKLDKKSFIGLDKIKSILPKNVDVKKHISPKSLFFTRPTLGHYFPNKELLREAADILFTQIKYGKVKIKIFKKYKLENIVEAHKDLEKRKIIGPAIIIP